MIRLTHKNQHQILITIVVLIFLTAVFVHLNKELEIKHGSFIRKKKPSTQKQNNAWSETARETEEKNYFRFYKYISWSATSHKM